MKNHQLSLNRYSVYKNSEIEWLGEKYIIKPFEYLENVVGVDINFNKVFYKPEKLRSVEEILEEIVALDQELRDLEQLIIL